MAGPPHSEAFKLRARHEPIEFGATDDYFDGLEVEAVSRDSGWRRIESLARLFPRFAEG
jgi:hypothetical protein